jgi:ribonuclease-3
MNETLGGLAESLGHRFERPELLDEALTHTSAAGRTARRAPRGYQRLEFLGDRVLGLVIAELLFTRYPSEAEGPLSRRLTELVRQETLAEVAVEAGLGPHMLIAAGEDTGEMRENASLLADVCEAVIAALYLDGGLEAAARFIRRHWTVRIEAAVKPPKDPKTELQEWAQARSGTLPRYRLVKSEGPPHKKRFTMEVQVPGAEPATGSGSSKRAAEIKAAAALLERLKSADGASG